jgi:hypothetical protein
MIGVLNYWPNINRIKYVVELKDVAELKIV